MARGLIDRFNSFIDKDEESGCWEWMGNKHRQGYGKISFMGKATPAHRISYELFKGCVPKNMMVCHRCDRPSCVNPDHLFIGSAMDNMRDKIEKGRHKGAKTGSAHHKAKLVEEDVVAIKHSAKLQHQLAEEFNVSQSQISMIKRGLRWHHVA